MRRTRATLGAMAKVLFPLPDRDFDVTEVAVPWKLLREAGHEVVFATEAGATPACDPLLLTGVVFGKLGARPEPIAFYREIEQAPEFVAPRRVERRATPTSSTRCSSPAATRPACASTSAARTCSALDRARSSRPTSRSPRSVTACSSPRARSAPTAESVLHGVRTTCLPKYMERAAYFSTFWRRGRYYRTYPAYVEDEVRAALAQPERLRARPAGAVEARHARRRHARVRRRGRPLRVGALARRRVPDREEADRALAGRWPRDRVPA